MARDQHSACSWTQLELEEEIKHLLEENGGGHLFKAIKEVISKYFEKKREKQQTGGGLSAGVQGGTMWAARTRPPGHGCQDLATRTWMPGLGRQDVDART